MAEITKKNKGIYGWKLVFPWSIAWYECLYLCKFVPEDPLLHYEGANSANWKSSNEKRPINGSVEENLNNCKETHGNIWWSSPFSSILDISLHCFSRLFCWCQAEISKEIVSNILLLFDFIASLSFAGSCLDMLVYTWWIIFLPPCLSYLSAG